MAQWFVMKSRAGNLGSAAPERAPRRLCSGTQLGEVTFQSLPATASCMLSDVNRQRLRWVVSKT